jgi:hypothetical protein
MARVRACEILIERGYGRASDESTLLAIDEAVIARDTPIVFQWQMGEPADELDARGAAQTECAPTAPAGARKAHSFSAS